MRLNLRWQAVETLLRTIPASADALRTTRTRALLGIDPDPLAADFNNLLKITMDKLLRNRATQ